MMQAPDVALSTCEVTLKPQSCSRRDCGREVVRVIAVSDFVDDGDRRTQIITEPAQSESLLWKSHNPPDVSVSGFRIVSSFDVISVKEKDLRIRIRILGKLFTVRSSSNTKNWTTC